MEKPETNKPTREELDALDKVLKNHADCMQSEWLEGITEKTMELVDSLTHKIDAWANEEEATA